MENPHTSLTPVTLYGESARPYVIGLVLSLLLTLTAFGLVEIHVWSQRTVFSHPFLYAAIVVCAVLQFFVQMFCFFTLGKRGNTLNRVAFAFALVVVGIVVGGSLWIMQNLNARMMLPPDQMMQYMQDQDSAM